MSANHGLFRDVAEPSATFDNHQGRSVAATVAIEIIAIGALLVVPLVASPILPNPRSAIAYIVAAPAPPVPSPPRPARPLPPPDATLVVESAFPIAEPDALVPEPAVDRNFDAGPALTAGFVNASPSDVIDAPPPPPPSPELVAAPAVVAPIRVGGAVRPPTKTKHVTPDYPRIAQDARVGGVVIVEAVIGTDGRVREARALRSIPLLDQAALDAVRQWEFTPTLLNGESVAVIMTVTVQFTLR